MVLILSLEELDLGKLCLYYLPKWFLFSTKETAEEECVLFANIFNISKKPKHLVTVKLLHLLLFFFFFSYFLNHSNPQGFSSDLSCCLLVPILTVASESHTYLTSSKERKTLSVFSPYLRLLSLFSSEVILGAV